MTTATHLLVLVEDDDFDADFLTRMFEDAKCQIDIHRCRNAVEARAFVRDPSERATNYDCVAFLFDIRLPDGNGLELINEFRHAHHISETTPVLVWSTSDSPADQQRAEELSIMKFYPKFETLDAGRAMVQDLCGRIGCKAV